MGKVGGNRNFGYGKKLGWAAKNALDARYGHGHYATKAAHLERWRQFETFLKDSSIKDARNITSEHLISYAKGLRVGVDSNSSKVAYAQNILSSINVVLEALRGDKTIRVSPSKLVGERSHVRKTGPVSLDRTKLNPLYKNLEKDNEPKIAMVASLARELGIRFREASLIDCRFALSQAEKLGKVNITMGTKGGRGREVDRWIPVNQTIIKTLKEATRHQGGSRNLIPENLSFKQWKQHAYFMFSKHKEEDGLKGFHDLRAAYACERYKEITGKSAPVVTGHRLVDKQTDVKAREIISLELGHSRIDITAAYLGSSK